QHRNSEGEDSLENPTECLVRHSGNLKQVVITPDDSLRAHGPETDAGKQEHKRVMDQNSGGAQRQEPEDLRGARYEMQLVCGIYHDCDCGTGVDKSAKIHLAQRDYKARIDWQQQEKIHFAGANQFGEVGAIDQEEGLE